MNETAEKTIKDTVKITGIHTFRKYDMTSPEAKGLEQRIESHIATFKDCKDFVSQANYHITYRKLFDELQKFKTGEIVIKNIVVTVGRSILAQRLANTTTYTGTINYGALGSSSTAVANADTQLGTEVFRKVVASASYTNNVAFIDFFFAKADTNGTYQEFGTFIDATGTANSGQMFTHALTGGWTKSSSESMTVSCQYSFN